MIREPKIPMSPEDLPQQRIHEVATLPKRPAEFDCQGGYELFPYGEFPKMEEVRSTGHVATASPEPFQYMAMLIASHCPIQPQAKKLVSGWL